MVDLVNREIPASWYPKSRKIGHATRDLLTETAYQHMAEIDMTQEEPTELGNDGKMYVGVFEANKRKLEFALVEAKFEEESAPRESEKTFYSRVIASVMAYIRERLALVPESSSIATHRKRKIAGIGVGPTCAERVAVALQLIDYLSKKSVHQKLLKPVYLNPSVFHGQLAESASEAFPRMTLTTNNRWI